MIFLRKMFKVIGLCLLFFCLPAQSIAQDGSATITAHDIITEPDDGYAPILDAIATAKTNIDIAVYEFNAQKLIDALIAASHRGVKVRVALEKESFSSSNRNQETAQILRASGIAVNWEPRTFVFNHQKLLLIDNKLAIVLTANLVFATFANERNFGVKIKDADSVAAAQQIFNHDWSYQTATPQLSLLKWGPNDSRPAILRVINGAQKTLDIYAPELSDREVIQALAHAAHRGVKIRLLSSSNPDETVDQDERLYRETPYYYLTKVSAAVRLLDDLYIHAKVIIADYQTDAPSAYIGSANLSKNSLDCNRELGVIISNSNALQPVMNIFDHDWLAATVFFWPKHNETRINDYIHRFLTYVPSTQCGRN